MNHISQIALTAIISSLLLLIEHYAVLPYVRSVWRTDLHLLARYVLGVLAINGSLAILFATTDMDNVTTAAAVVVVVTISGLSTFSCYALDSLAARVAEWYESSRLEK